MGSVCFWWIFDKMLDRTLPIVLNKNDTEIFCELKKTYHFSTGFYWKVITFQEAISLQCALRKSYLYHLKLLCWHSTGCGSAPGFSFPPKTLKIVMWREPLDRVTDDVDERWLRQFESANTGLVWWRGAISFFRREAHLTRLFCKKKWSPWTTF